MESRKRIILYFFIMTFLLESPFFHVISAETKQEKKLVYVVLDDSGSMGSGVADLQGNIISTRWHHSQYAIEVLTGLLNPGDHLEFFYLNDAIRDAADQVQWTADLSAAGIQSSMHKAVSDGGAEGNTPFTQVTAAWEQMQKVNEDFDKYWLVVISDGYYEGFGSEQELRSEFERFAGQMMGPDHNKRLNLIYLTIGDSGGYKIDKDPKTKADLEKEGIYCYDAGDSKIVERMGEIADIISGRTRFTGDMLTEVDGNTISVRSDFPLFNFVVLVQGSGAKLEKAELGTNNGLTISRSAEVERPKGNREEYLSGSVYTVDNGNDTIPADTYILHFDSPINKNQIIVLVEPALEVRLTHNINGNILGDTEKPEDCAHIGDSYSVGAEIYEYGTQVKVNRSLLPAGSKVVVEIVNGSNSDRSETRDAVIKKLNRDQVSVTGTLTIPGFTPIIKAYDFTPSSTPVYTIAVNPEQTSVSQAGLSEGLEFEITLKEDKKQVSPGNLEIVLKENGNPIPPAEMRIDPASDKTDTKKQVRTVKVIGNINTDPKEYSLEVKHIPDTGAPTVIEVPFMVTESVYDIQPAADHDLIFSSPLEMYGNQEKYRFNITVDGRNLTDEELRLVTSCEMEADETSTIITPGSSGYDVVPHAAQNWTPSQNYIEFTVTCSAPGISKSMVFYYNFVIYEVECIIGDGLEIPADDLLNNTEGLSFRVYATDGNGRRALPYNMLENLYAVEAKPSFDYWLCPVSLDDSIEIGADGEYLIRVVPKSHSGKFINAYNRVWPFTRPGDVQIKLTYKSASDEGMLRLVRGSFLDYWPHVLTLLIIIIIIGYCTKKRFGPNACMYVCPCSVVGNKIVGNKKMQKWPLLPGLGVLWPFGKDSTNVQGLDVRATGYGTVEVNIGGKMIAKEINETPKKGENVKVTNPVSADALERGWHELPDESVIVVFRRDSKAALYYYKSDNN